jgi:UDP-glucose 4-epimerase
MRILLTGATGFIGRHLLPELAGDHEVFAVAKGEPPAGSSAEWIRGDLSGTLDRSTLPKAVDAVIHLAQSKRYRDFPDGAADVFAVNVRSTFDLLEYARAAGASRFLYASTGGVYGSSDTMLSESDRLDPLDFYLSSKCSGEALVAGYRGLFNTIVFRFFFVYGRGQTGMLVPTLVNRVTGGETITIDGEPGLRINPIHVSDATRIFEPALTLERSELVNVAGDEIVTITDLVRVIERASGRTASIEYSDSALPGDLVASNERMKDVLGVHPRMSLDDGIRSML